MASARLLEINMMSKDDRELFQSLQKIMALVITFISGFGCVMSGMYGPIAELGVPVCALIIAQMVAAQLIIILLDELLQKGYGLGSGVSLFIATNICAQFLLNLASNQHLPAVAGGDPKDFQYEGALIAFIYNLFARPNKLAGVSSALFRLDGPNLYRCIVTIGLILLAVYVQQYRVEIKLSSRKMRGFRQPYPIKLIYAGNICLIVYVAIVQNVYTWSQITASYFPGNFLFGLLGKWGIENNFNKAPTGGLAYYVTPQFGIVNFLLDPIGTAIYVGFLGLVCV